MHLPPPILWGSQAAVSSLGTALLWGLQSSSLSFIFWSPVLLADNPRPQLGQWSCRICALRLRSSDGTGVSALVRGSVPMDPAEGCLLGSSVSWRLDRGLPAQPSSLGMCSIETLAHPTVCGWRSWGPEGPGLGHGHMLGWNRALASSADLVPQGQQEGRGSVCLVWGGLRPAPAPLAAPCSQGGLPGGGECGVVPEGWTLGQGASTWWAVDQSAPRCGSESCGRLYIESDRHTARQGPLGVVSAAFGEARGLWEPRGGPSPAVGTGQRLVDRCPADP